MPLLHPRKGAGPATGKTKPSRAELLMNATQALANEQLPDEHTMTAIEGEPGSGTDAADAAGAGQAAAASAQRTGSRPAAEPASGATMPNAGTGGTARSRKATSPAGRRAADEPAAAATLAATPPAAASPRPSARSVAAAPARTDGPDAAAGADAEPADGAMVVRRVPAAAIRPSPFQPRGRPSVAAVDAVRHAIGEAGSLESLVGPDGGAIFVRLSPEAARLAELAFDIQQHGMKIPVEVRTTDDGGLECLSGHRRLAAAKLAGIAEVPALERGAMSNAAAAATVLRGNLHRENFTTWQEAVLVTEVQDRRRADGHRDNVRKLGAVMGWSHGKVNTLLRIRRALSPTFLDRLGDGDPGRIEELLAQAPYRELERLGAEENEERRLARARQLLGLGDADPRRGTATAAPVCEERPKRNGGFLIEVRQAVEHLTESDARHLREILETQIARVDARLSAFGRR